MFHAALDPIAARYQAWLATGVVFLGVLVLAYGVGRYLVHPPLMRLVRGRNAKNPTLVDAVDTYLKVLFFVLALPVATTAAGFGRVVAGSAVIVAAATLALGVAGQDVIGNLVSGAFLVADPEFNVGDRVAWDGHEGVVERIDLRVTRIRTPAGEIMTVPNTELATSSLVEPFAWYRYRVRETIPVAYGEPLDEVREILRQAALVDDRVLEEPAPTVQVAELGDDAVKVATRFWVAPPRQVDVPDVRAGFLAGAEERLREAGIQVAPPSGRALSGTVDVGEGPARQEEREGA